MAVPLLDAFQVVADPSRREILHLLSKESLTINELADNFDMSRPAVSKHIRILNESGFVSIENSGRNRYCTLQQEGFNQLKEWMEYFDNFWLEKLNQLGSALDSDKGS